MSGLALAERDGLQPGEVLAHLDEQIASSRRLLQALIAQTDAIRQHEVEQVLLRLREIQVEIGGRARLELDREALLVRAGRALAVAPETLDIQALMPLLAEHERRPALARSAELRGLAKEIQDVHQHNRILIRQELAFVDHLLRAMSGTPQGGYTPDGPGASVPVTLATLDLRA